MPGILSEDSGRVLRPGMEDGEHAGGAANVALIAGEFDDRLGGSLHQQRIPVALVGAHQARAVLAAP